jgi:hypothetical protein
MLIRSDREADMGFAVERETRGDRDPFAVDVLIRKGRQLAHRAHRGVDYERTVVGDSQPPRAAEAHPDRVGIRARSDHEFLLKIASQAIESQVNAAPHAAISDQSVVLEPGEPSRRIRTMDVAVRGRQLHLWIELHCRTRAEKALAHHRSLQRSARCLGKAAVGGRNLAHVRGGGMRLAQKIEYHATA